MANDAFGAQRMGLAAAMLSVGILLSRLLGYVREAVIAYQQGAGAATDAYNAAFLLPDLMNYFLAGGTLSITFIPIFGAFLAQGREDEGWRLFSIIGTTMGLFLTAGIVVAEIFAESLVRWLFPGFGPESVALTVEMTRVVLPAQLFHYIGGLMLATLMAQGRFLAATFAPLVYNAGIIVFGLLLGPVMGMKAFAVGALVGAIAGPFGLSLYQARGIVRFRPLLSLSDPGFRRYLWLSVPLMLGVSLTTVDEWLGRILGSSMEEGSISWLNYGRRLMLVPIAVIGQAAGQAALPFLSRLAGEGKREELALLLSKTLRVVLLLALVATGVTLVLAEPLVVAVYERGAFAAGDTARTAVILRLFALGIGAWGVQMVAVRAFYAEQNTWTPMLLSSGITVLSVPVYLVLGARWGVYGLAGAASAGMVAQSLAVLWFYGRSNRAFPWRNLLEGLWRGLLLAAVASLGASLGLLLPFDLGRSTGAFVALLVGGGGAALALVLAAPRIAPQEWTRLSGMVSSRLGRYGRRKKT